MQKTKTSYGYILNDLTTFIWVTPIYDLTRRSRLQFREKSYNSLLPAECVFHN